MRIFALLAMMAVLASAAGATAPRASSDFEIAAMKRQLESSRDAFSRFSAHLNLGDAFLSRGESARARGHYTDAFTLAQEEMTRSREISALRRYARATSYAGLAAARLGRDGEAYRLLEESLRYDSDSASTWNVYASAMTVLGQHVRSVSAARNAVTIASRSTDRSISDALDLNIYRYALASALSQSGTTPAELEAEDLLHQVVGELTNGRFDALRRRIAREEQFEIFSSTRTDSSAYLSLLNRSRLRLARIFEESGRLSDAEEQYGQILRDRVDDPEALAGMARLATGDERLRYFEASFDASPFSLALVRQYEDFVRNNAEARSRRQGAGAIVQRAIEEATAGRHPSAVALLEPLLSSQPDNSTLLYLTARSEILGGRFDRAREMLARPGMAGNLSDELRALIAREESDAGRLPNFMDAGTIDHPVVLSPEDLSLLLRRLRNGSLSPEHLARLDELHFIAPVSFEKATARDIDTTTFHAGSMYRQPFRFNSPTTFRGRYEDDGQHELEFQILGVTTMDGRELLLVQPRKVSS